MPRSTALIFVATALGTLGACSAAAGQRPSSAGEDRQALGQCAEFRWDQPSVVRTASGNMVYVERPQIVDLDSATLFLGSWGLELNDRWETVAQTVGRSLSHYTAGITISRHGIARSVPMPDTITQFDSPRLLKDANGAVRVIWAPDTETLDPSTLYTAVLSASGWSSVAPLPIGWSLAWTFSSGPVAIDNGQLLVSGTALRESNGGVLLRYTSGQWLSMPLRIDNATYARLTVADADTLLLAFVAAAAPHGNTLFAQRLTADGTLIGRTERVSSAEDGVVFEPLLARDINGLLYVAWAGSTDQSLAFKSLHVAQSRDGGRTWRRLAKAHLPQGFDMPSAVLDSAGRLHVVVRIAPGQASQPLHLVWTGDAWRQYVIPSMQSASNEGRPVVFIGDNGLPHVAWGAFVDRSLGPRPAVLVWSRSRLACR